MHYLRTPSQSICVVLFAPVLSICFCLFPCLCQSEVCYVKAALPWTLELLSTHFHYVSSSENGQDVRALKSIILNIYSQQCAPVINEEEEVSGCFIIILNRKKTIVSNKCNKLLTIRGKNHILRYAY